MNKNCSNLKACHEFRICPVLHNFKKRICIANNTEATVSQKTDAYHNAEVKLLTNSLQHSPPPDFSSSSARLRPYPDESTQRHSILIFKIHFTIFPSRSRSSKWSPSYRLPTKTLHSYHFSPVPWHSG